MIGLLRDVALAALRLFGGRSVDRILRTIDRNISDKTERERIKAGAVNNYINAQAKVLTGPGWWFPLFFIVPLGIWFTSVCIYSVLWCKGCAFPQDWTIAALPAPLDEWSGWIVSGLFLGAFGDRIVSKFR
ncbi:MAG: hypothetical protein AAF468_19890 [Pseudomonadota bacterium]